MAAWLALTQFGEGSSPSSPTFENSEVGSGNSEVFQIKKLPTSDLQIPNSQLETHWSSSGQDFAFVMRRRGFDSHPVLLIGSTREVVCIEANWQTLRIRIFDNLVSNCVHDVAVAYCLAMAEVWVRLPLDALNSQVPLADWQRRQISNLVRRVRFSQGTLFKSELGGRKYSKHFRIPTSDFQICNGPSVQSGVGATLSRWRSPVRIRYGSLFPNRNWEVGNRKCELRAAYSDLRFPNSEFETVRYANGLSDRSQKPVSVSSNLTRTTEQNAECGLRNSAFRIPHCYKPEGRRWRLGLIVTQTTVGSIPTSGALTWGSTGAGGLPLKQI